MDVLTLEILEHRINMVRFGHKECLAYKRLDRHLIANIVVIAQLVEFLDDVFEIQHADDCINVALVHRKPAVTLAHKDFERVIERLVYGAGSEFGTRNHDFAHSCLAVVNGGTHNPALDIFKTALPSRFVEHDFELFLYAFGIRKLGVVTR